MSKKKPTKKGSSKSKKAEPKKAEKVDLSEYEDQFDGMDVKKPEAIDYDEYEVPEGFEKEEKIEKPLKEMKWFQRQLQKMRDLDDNQRLYWIKILSGCVAGVLLGLFGAKTGWWLFLLIGVYAAITAGGYFLFKLKWNFKEVIFSGFFPYLALFVMFWVLMFSSLYAPSMAEWYNVLKTVITETVNGTEIVYTATRTTSAAGPPFVSILLTIAATLGLLQFFLRRQKRAELTEKS